MKYVKLNHEFNLNYPLFKGIFSFPPFKKNEDNKRSLSKRSTDSTIENNDHNLKKLNLAFAIAIMLFALGTGNLAQAQIEKTIRYEPKLMEDGTYEFDIAAACQPVAKLPGIKICNLVAKNAMKLKITFGANSSKPDWFDSTYNSNYGYLNYNSYIQIISPILESTHPMKSAFGTQCLISNKERKKDSYSLTFINDTNNRFYGCYNDFSSGINL